jgi:putative endonuclease
MNKQGFVYIMTNKAHTVLYTGVTSDLVKRVDEHKRGEGAGFTQKYNVTRLVWYKVADDIRAAIEREKQVKAGSRQKKIDLINAMNPDWSDLGEDLS